MTPAVKLVIVYDVSFVVALKLLDPLVHWTLKWDSPPVDLVQLRDADDVVKSVTWRSVITIGSVLFFF